MNPLFFVAEMSANHNGSLDTALAIIKAAKDSGANAVKFQTYTPDSMVADKNYTLADGPWKGRKLYDLYQEAQTPWEWHREMFEYARSIGITPFSTPFDKEAVDFLEKLDCPIYKIASFEITDLDLIRYVASTGKPMIVSTGMASWLEIDDVVGFCAENPLTLLKCTSAYPAPASSANLATLESMIKNWGREVGLSDHTKGSAVACAAVALGATVFEKHFTIDRNIKTADSMFSVEPSEFKKYVEDITSANEAAVWVKYGPTEAEASSFALRRSLYFARDVKAGDTLVAEDLRTARPALGAKPNMLPFCVGRKLLMDCSAGQPFTGIEVG